MAFETYGGSKGLFRVTSFARVCETHISSFRRVNKESTTEPSEFTSPDHDFSCLTRLRHFSFFDTLCISFAHQLVYLKCLLKKRALNSYNGEFFRTKSHGSESRPVKNTEIWRLTFARANKKVSIRRYIRER